MQYVISEMWGCDTNVQLVTRQINNIARDNRYTLTGALLTLYYVNSILYRRFEPQYGISYIIDRYYKEAEKYWFKRKSVKQSILNNNIGAVQSHTIDIENTNTKLNKLKIEEFWCFTVTTQQ